MFEKYDINKLYYCSINSFSPFSIDNFGGLISIDGVDNGDYNSIVYKDFEKYIDIKNPKRLINTPKDIQCEMLKVSKDRNIYELKMDTLKKVTGVLLFNSVESFEKISVRKLQKMLAKNK